jgi:hypothetical protein
MEDETAWRVEDETIEVDLCALWELNKKILN